MANRYRAGLWFATALLLPLFGQPAFADEPPLPQKGSDAHLGVVSCAGSTCHGATKPFQNSSVLQNEFVTWQRHDKHAQAYKVLLNDQSKRIAAVLESLHEVVMRAQRMNEDPKTIEISGSPTPQFDIESDLEARLKKIDEDSPDAEA